MAFSRLVFALLVLSVVQCYASIPVFLWGELSKPSLKSYPMVTISDQEFDSLLKREFKGNPFTVVFVEETLAVEDFSLKNAEGETALPYLHANLGKAVYIPAVADPLDALSSISGPNDNYVRLTEDGLTSEIEPEGGSFVFINFRDAREGESRSDLLRRHNDFMQKTMIELQEKYDNIVALYTAVNPSWTVVDDDEIARVRRQAETTDGVALISVPSLLLYSEKIYINDEDVRPSYASGTSEVDEAKTSQNSTLLFKDYSLVFRFVHQAGYWLLDSISISTNSSSETLNPTDKIYALTSDSYRCLPNVTLVTYNATTSYVLTFQDMQIQPYFNTSSDPETLQFGDTFNCVGFFTIPIWAGLFITAIMIIILFIGIIMIMDIRTMDRFDDPKGKTITINPLDQ